MHHAIDVSMHTFKPILGGRLLDFCCFNNEEEKEEKGAALTENVLENFSPVIEQRALTIVSKLSLNLSKANKLQVKQCKLKLI